MHYISHKYKLHTAVVSPGFSALPKIRVQARRNFFRSNESLQSDDVPRLPRVSSCL